MTVKLCCSLHGRMEPSPADTIYFAQTKIIKSLAEKESCVIVGRCSDYILRDNSGCFTKSTFINSFKLTLK